MHALATAIADAKTNFFMQCSWELPKWKLLLSQPQPIYATALLCSGSCMPRCRFKRYHSFHYGDGRIIESHAPPDKRRAHSTFGAGMPLVPPARSGACMTCRMPE